MTEAGWPGWLRAHDDAIRERLTAGDEDTIVNWLLLGTSFTRQPRAFLDVPASRLQELSSVIAARMHDLVVSLAAPGADERRQFARAFFERKGFRFQTVADRNTLEQHLAAAVARVGDELARYKNERNELRRLGDASAEFAALSKLYRDRGLSLDTSIQPSFALDESLAELKQRGLLTAVRNVAVIGPGLDFSDKNAGYDFYPQQTLQPFALIDSLVRLGLADRAQLPALTTLDLSPRVNDHLARAKQRAAGGGAYTIRVPLDTSVPWTPQFLAYWNDVGRRIGTAVTAPAGAGSAVRVRTVTVPPPVMSRIDAQDLDVVVQRFTDRRFDLIVATNIFVYYDTFDQALAMANVAAMLRPGGLLLSNNALVEVPSTRLRSIGYRTTQYSGRPDDGDHVVWYQRPIQ